MGMVVPPSRIVGALNFYPENTFMVMEELLCTGTEFIQAELHQYYNFSGVKAEYSLDLSLSGNVFEQCWCGTSMFFRFHCGTSSSLIFISFSIRPSLERRG